MKLQLYVWSGVLVLLCGGCGEAAAPMPAPVTPPSTPAPVPALQPAPGTPVAPAASASKPSRQQLAAGAPTIGQPVLPLRPDAPKFVLAIDVPSPSEKLYDLSLASIDTLQTEIEFAAKGRRFAAAAQLQYWLYAKSGRGGYDLACYLAEAGKRDEALYYLQVAAVKEGVDREDAETDQDLASLRGDPRWPTVQKFLAESEVWWTKLPIVETTCIVPSGYKNGWPIPVVLGLHGYGANANYFTADEYQDYADRLQVAFVAISATQPLGEHRFRWSEDRKLDETHILKGLEALRDKVTPQKGKLLLMGFSQGAEMAFEIAAADPDQFCGAFVLSPGTKDRSRDFTSLASSVALKNSHFLICYNEREHPMTIASAKRDYAWALESKVDVEVKVTPILNKHTYPPDFDELLEARLTKLLSLGKK